MNKSIELKVIGIEKDVVRMGAKGVTLEINSRHLPVVVEVGSVYFISLATEAFDTKNKKELAKEILNSLLKNNT